MRCRLAGGAVAEPRNLGDDRLRLRLEAQPSIAHPAVRNSRVVNGTLAVAPSPRGPRGGDGATSAHGNRAAPDARRYDRRVCLSYRVVHEESGGNRFA